MKYCVFVLGKGTNTQTSNNTARQKNYIYFSS